MAGQVNQSVQVGYSPVGIYNGPIPQEGPKCVPVQLDFSLQNTYQIDFSLIYSRKFITELQAVFIDNSLSTTAFKLIVNGSNQNIVCPAGGQGIFPIFCPNPPKFIAQSTGGVVVACQFLNVPITCLVWNATAATFLFTGAGYLETSDVALDALIAGGMLPVNVLQNNVTTDGSGTIAAGGTAQSLFALNAGRHGFFVQNPTSASASLWISELAAAVVGEPSIEVPPGMVWEADETAVPLTAISIIGATTGMTFTARQW